MRIMAFTGAGISKESNIPTFMEKPEVREKLFRTFAQRHPQEYNQVIKDLKDTMRDAQPNDAHYALAEYNIPIITMNIDGLHQKAGSKPLELHGGLPADQDLDIAYTLYEQPVLYGDAAPNYVKAFDEIVELKSGDVLLIIGSSFHTSIAGDIYNLAYNHGVKVIMINDHAATKVRQTLEQLLPNGPQDPKLLPFSFEKK